MKWYKNTVLRESKTDDVEAEMLFELNIGQPGNDSLKTSLNTVEKTWNKFIFKGDEVLLRQDHTDGP